MRYTRSYKHKQRPAFLKLICLSNKVGVSSRSYTNLSRTKCRDFNLDEVNHVYTVTLPSRQIQNAPSQQVFQGGPQIFHQTEYNNMTMMTLQELLSFPA